MPVDYLSLLGFQKQAYSARGEVNSTDPWILKHGILLMNETESWLNLKNIQFKMKIKLGKFCVWYF